MVSTAASAASDSGTNTFLRDISDEQMIELLDRTLCFMLESACEWTLRNNSTMAIMQK